MASEGEDAQRVVIGDAPRRARLVVPVVDRHVGCDRAEDRARVSVAPSGEHGESAVVDRRLYERTRIEDAEVGFTVPRGRWLARLTRDRRAREPSVARRRGARIEVDVIDERRVDHPLADAHVKQQGHSYPVDVVAVVVRRSSADVEVREPAGQRDDAWQRLDRAKRIAESAGHLTHVGGRERGLADLPPCAVHVHFLGRFRGLNAH